MEAAENALTRSGSTPWSPPQNADRGCGEAEDRQRKTRRRADFRTAARSLFPSFSTRPSPCGHSPPSRAQIQTGAPLPTLGGLARGGDGGVAGRARAGSSELRGDLWRGARFGFRGPPSAVPSERSCARPAPDVPARALPATPPHRSCVLEEACSSPVDPRSAVLGDGEGRGSERHRGVDVGVRRGARRPGAGGSGAATGEVGPECWRVPSRGRTAAPPLRRALKRGGPRTRPPRPPSSRRRASRLTQPDLRRRKKTRGWG